MAGADRDQKAIRKKMAMAEKGNAAPRAARAARDPRLPPGQHEAKVWPVLDLGIRPLIRHEDFVLDVNGSVLKPRVLRWADLLTLPKAVLVTDFHCVTTWSVFDHRFGGVLLRDIIDSAAPSQDARHVLFGASDGYTTNLPLDACRDDDVLLVHTWNGQPLPAEHGGPVRVIVPKRYGWKSAKWVRSITLLPEDQKGFWELRGYSNTAFPWEEDRFS
jgi:DMSO/TMAO reductase YedYZ molybdopterin-dependent catalytic subunit